MAGIRIEGNTSGNVAEVNANNQLQVATPLDPDQAGYMRLSGTLSETGEPAGLIAEPLRTSVQGRLIIGQTVTLFSELFNNTALNSAIFTAPVTTMTVTCAGGSLNLNASNITTVSTVARVSTYAYFPFQPDLATYATFDALLTQSPQNNCIIEMGFGIATASSTPTDGAFFRYTATGTLICVVNTNGAEITSGSLTTPSTNVMNRYRVIVENDRVFFYINGVCQAVLDTPNTSGFPVYANAQPWFARVINTAIAPTLANQLKIGYVFVGQQDAGGNARDVGMIQSLMGRHASQGQTGHTMGTTALLTNSLAAGAGVAATNTTAALGTGLGGQFACQPTLAVGTDGIISSYQNPVPTAAIPGKTLYIKGVRVQTVVTTALTGGPVVYEYQLAYGHTAVTLATTESATAKAPRRVGIGFESIAATAAVGVVGSQNGQYMPFNAPIAVYSGEFVQVLAKNLGVVTTAGVVLFLISFDAYFE